MVEQYGSKHTQKLIYIRIPFKTSKLESVDPHDEQTPTLTKSSKSVSEH